MGASGCARRDFLREVRARQDRSGDRALEPTSSPRKKTMVYRGMNAPSSFVDLPDRDLLLAVKRLVEHERHATAALVASLAEVDARRLFLGEGCASLFVYCTRVLHLSESAAYARIAAARAGRRFPLILELLAGGDVTLTTVCLLAPHVTDDNHRGVLEAARHKGKREVEQLVAALHPRPDIPSTIRKLPAPKVPEAPTQTVRLPVADAVEAARVPVLVSSRALTPETAPTLVPVAPSPAPRPAVVVPLAPERFKVQFTVGRQTHDKLRRAQDLLRHAVPNGDPAEIFDRALTLLLEHLERTKLASAKRPRVSRALVTQSRHIPSAVKRAVWHRDAARCAFVGVEGRCTERGFLEFHHVVPYASGGAATEENIYLRCRAHNQHEAEEVFGRRDLFVRERPPRLPLFFRGRSAYREQRALLVVAGQLVPDRVDI
jgi:5-methylcytosine-specific restriction endonuclease McrA